MENKKLFACFLLVLIISSVVNARPQDLDSTLVERDAEGKEPSPSWIRRQLWRAGEAASKVGNSVGGYAVKLTNAVDRICAVIKKIIPIVGAVCTVGQFQFCALDNGTGGLEGALPIEGASVPYSNSGPQTDFDEVDK